MKIEKNIETISPMDLSYIAGIIDTIGNFNITSQNNRYFCCDYKIQIKPKDSNIVMFLIDVFGGSSVQLNQHSYATARTLKKKRDSLKPKKLVWYISGDELLNACLQFRPYLKSKQKIEACDLAIKMRMTYLGQGQPGGAGIRDNLLDYRREIMAEYKEYKKNWKEQRASLPPEPK